MKESTIKVLRTNGSKEYYKAITYHKFYDNTLRLYRNKDNSRACRDIFIPLNTVKSVEYVNPVEIKKRQRKIPFQHQNLEDVSKMPKGIMISKKYINIEEDQSAD